MNNDDNAEDKELLDEELHLLSSVYCLPGESCQLTARAPRVLIEVTQVIQADLQPLKVKIVFELEQHYPRTAPHCITLQCHDRRLSRADCSSIAAALKSEAHSLKGESMLWQLCQSAKETLTTFLAQHANEVSSSSNDQERRVVTVADLVELDHMRNSVGYVKTLTAWAHELEVDLRIYNMLFRKRGNIWILIVGEESRVKTFKKYLRTRTVDIDSKGRPCKERLASDLCCQTLQSTSPLCQGGSKGGNTFEIAIDSPQTLQSHFEEINQGEMFLQSFS